MRMRIPIRNRSSSLYKGEDKELRGLWRALQNMGFIIASIIPALSTVLASLWDPACYQIDNHGIIPGCLRCVEGVSIHSPWKILCLAPGPNDGAGDRVC
jgi:hypothetical protein